MLQSWWIPRRCVCNRCPFDCALSFPVFYCMFVGTLAYTLQMAFQLTIPDEAKEYLRSVNLLDPNRKRRVRC